MNRYNNKKVANKVEVAKCSLTLMTTTTVHWSKVAVAYKRPLYSKSRAKLVFTFKFRLLYITLVNSQMELNLTPLVVEESSSSPWAKVRSSKVGMRG